MKSNLPLNSLFVEIEGAGVISLRQVVCMLSVYLSPGICATRLGNLINGDCDEIHAVSYELRRKGFITIDKGGLHNCGRTKKAVYYPTDKLKFDRGDDEVRSGLLYLLTCLRSGVTTIHQARFLWTLSIIPGATTGDLMEEMGAQQGSIHGFSNKLWKLDLVRVEQDQNARGRKGGHPFIRHWLTKKGEKLINLGIGGIAA